MTFVSKQLNLWGRHKKQETIADSCPPEHLKMLMSPDNKTDWTRAVWLIYSELGLQTLKGWRFSVSTLTQMETFLFSNRERYRGKQRENQSGGESPERAGGKYASRTTQDLLAEAADKLHADTRLEESPSKRPKRQDMDERLDLPQHADMHSTIRAMSALLRVL